MKLFVFIFVLFSLAGCQTLSEQPTLDRSEEEYKAPKQIVLNDTTRLYSQTPPSILDKKTKYDNRYPYKLTGPKINDHFQRYKNYTFDKGPNRDFTLKIRSFKNIERDCDQCGTRYATGSMNIKGPKNQVCFYWDNVRYPSSSCFEVIQIEGNRYQLIDIDPVDGETYGYTVDGEPFDYTVDIGSLAIDDKLSVEVDNLKKLESVPRPPENDNDQTESETANDTSFFSRRGVSIGLVHGTISNDRNVLMDGESTIGYDFQMSLSRSKPLSIEFLFTQFPFLSLGRTPDESYTIFGLGPKINIGSSLNGGLIPWVGIFFTKHSIVPGSSSCYFNNCANRDAISADGMGTTLTLGVDFPKSNFRFAIRRHQADLSLGNTTMTSLLFSKLM